jgi:hypothetical protein
MTKFFLARHIFVLHLWIANTEKYADPEANSPQEYATLNYLMDYPES